MSIEPANRVCIMGIANCDSVRKARCWLDEKQIDHEFRDFRKKPLNSEELGNVLQRAGPDQLVNRRSASWRSLSAEDRDICQTALNAADTGSACATEQLVEILLKNQTMIKRPVLIAGSKTLCGFNEAVWSEACGV